MADKQRRESQAKIAARALEAQKKADGRLRAGAKKEKAERPKRCKIMSCKCVGLLRIRIKQPGLAGAVGTMWWTDIPYHTRNAGAQWQDMRFGQGRRLHNPGFCKGKLVGWTCTVCGERKDR